MFTSIVVALDLEATGDRALPIAAWLATLGDLPVDLITVSSQGMPTAADVFELERRAAAHGLVDDACLVLHGEDPGATIVERMASRPGALLVMGTTAKGPLAGPLFGSVSERVLALIETPVLVAGPRATADHLGSPTLLACVGGSDRAAIAAPVISSWVGTFGGSTWITTVAPPGPEPVADVVVDRLRQLGEGLATTGSAQPFCQVLRGDDPAPTLADLARTVQDPVFVAVSSRWTDAHRHSVTRDLVRRSTAPVLVLPSVTPRSGGGPDVVRRARSARSVRSSSAARRRTVPAGMRPPWP